MSNKSQSSQDEEKPPKAPDDEEAGNDLLEPTDGDDATSAAHSLEQNVPQGSSQEEEELGLLSNVQQLRHPSALEYATLEDGEDKMQMKIEEVEEEEHEEEEEEEPIPVVVVHKEVPKPKWRRYIYNNENNTYCERTPAHWCALCTYYLSIAIIFLAVFMIYIISFLWRDLNSLAPYYLKLTILPDPNPALAILPLDRKKPEMIIWYKSQGEGNHPKPQDYVESITKFIDDSTLACHQQMLLKKSCYFNNTDFGPCASASYGYDRNQPCIFLKLNNLLTWVPAPIPNSTELPPEISKSLAAQIRRESPRHSVYVDCRGETLYDQSYLRSVHYYPEAAYDIKYFPVAADTKTNPVIALQFNEIIDGHVLQIHCTLLAGNIKNKANSNIKLTVYHG